MPICFEFINGPLDGKRVSCESAEPRDARLARFLNVVTGGGAAGRWFRGVAPELLSEGELLRVPVQSLDTLVFEVAGREKLADHLLVRIRQRPL